jgi:hypothetical protein
MAIDIRVDMNFHVKVVVANRIIVFDWIHLPLESSLVSVKSIAKESETPSPHNEDTGKGGCSMIGSQNIKHTLFN